MPYISVLMSIHNEERSSDLDGADASRGSGDVRGHK